MATKNAAAQKAVPATKPASATKSPPKKSASKPKTAVKAAAVPKQMAPAAPKAAKKPAAEATTAAVNAKPLKKDPKPVTARQAPPAPAIDAANTGTTKKPVKAADPKDRWVQIREILLKMKQDVLLEIARSIKSGSESSTAAETSGDIYDQASSERDRELELLLNDRERDKLHHIDEALLRMSEGEYGICEECDEEIPVGRLKALPFTRHCVKCKSDLERVQAQTRWVDDLRAYREIPSGEDEEG